MGIFNKQRKSCASYFRRSSSVQQTKNITPKNIEKALKHCEFELFYQPILELNEDIHGAKVFIKWPQKDGHYLESNEFLPIAEKNASILKVTHWILNQTIIDLIFLREEGFTGCLHINLSAKTLQGEDLLHCAKFLADTHPFSIDQIVFEVNEKAIMEDLDAAKKTMFELSEIGFKLTINDFGAGLPSLALLQELPTNEIKMDSSLFDNIKEGSANDTLVKSTLYLAKKFDFNIVAEGIDTKEVTKKLSDLDCHYLQGYHFNQPVSFDHFLNIVTHPSKEKTA